MMEIDCDFAWTARAVRRTATEDRKHAHVLLYAGDAEIRVPRSRARTMTAAKLRQLAEDHAWAATQVARYFEALDLGGDRLLTFLDTSRGRITVPAAALRNRRTLQTYLVAARGRLRARKARRA